VRAGAEQRQRQRIERFGLAALDQGEGEMRHAGAQHLG
jgi:hypothetical protein